MCQVFEGEAHFRGPPTLSLECKWRLRGPLRLLWMTGCCRGPRRSPVLAGDPPGGTGEQPKEAAPSPPRVRPLGYKEELTRGGRRVLGSAASLAFQRCLRSSLHTRLSRFCDSQKVFFFPPSSRCLVTNRQDLEPQPRVHRRLGQLRAGFLVRSWMHVFHLVRLAPKRPHPPHGSASPPGEVVVRRRNAAACVSIHRKWGILPALRWAA